MKNKTVSIFISLFIILSLMISPTAIDAEDERVIIEIKDDNGNRLTGYQYLLHYVKPGDTLYKIS